MKLSTNIQVPSTGLMESERASQISSRLHHLGLIIPILIVYVSLAFYQIGHQSLWLDEVISVQVASDESFFSPVIWFRQSPLYFALLHVWAQSGTSDMFLRSLSVIFGGVAVFFTYVLGVRLFNQRVAWVGATVLATSPFLIWYSQEVRYITLMIATSLFSMYAFHRALSSNRRGWWVSYCCSLIVATAAFLSNILLPLVQGLFILCSPSRRHLLRKVLVCQMMFFALFIWWGNGGQLDKLGGRWEKLFNHVTLSSEKLSTIPRSERLSSGGNRDFELAAVPYTFFAFSTGFSMGPSVRELQVSRSSKTIKRYGPLLSILGVLFGGLFISGLIAVWRQRDRGILIILWLVIPIIGAAVISSLTDMAYNVRYVSMALPSYILILAVGISAFRRPVVQMILLGSVLLVNGFSISNYYFNPSYAREDSRNAAQYLESVARTRDIILVAGSDTGLRYYYKGESPIIRWNSKNNGDQLVVANVLRKLTKTYDRLWLVEVRPWQVDPMGKVKRALGQLYTFSQYQHFAGVEIHSYDL